ncbi:head-tail joining protein [Mixta calida]|uniref:head-tail joining protein n=1 Tax=Mixta calida TaxID=665913 RepID=UPI0028AE35A2|nr:head-tail joining protein [Mixta calida]
MSRFSAALGRLNALAIGTFSEPGGVTLWPDTSRRTVIKVVYDAPWQGTDVPDGGQIQGRDACFTAHDYDITGLKKGDMVIIRDKPLYVKNLQPDGTGLTVVYLSEYKKSSCDRTGGLL